MSMRRAGPDAVAGDVVRRRLAELVAEIRPHHVVDADEPDRDDQDPAAAGPAGEGGEVGADERTALSASPRRAGVGPEVVARVWEFGRAHVAVVAIIGLAGVLWAVLGMAQARTVPVPDAVAATPRTEAAASATPTPRQIVVHVVGAVNRPGVVRLPEGARVTDALEAAGGPAGEARLGELNLAALVADGAQVVVGTEKRPTSEVRGPGGTPSGSGAAGASGAAGDRIDLNTATQPQLETLPGVGPVLAQKILAWRAQHGRFARVEELQEVDGIGPKTYQQLAPRVRV